MSEPSTDLPVVHNAAAHRFEAVAGDAVALMAYRLDGSTATFVHTEVPPALEGRGLARRLVDAAFAHAREAGWTVVPACSYVAGYVKKHPEVQDLLQ